MAGITTRRRAFAAAAIARTTIASTTIASTTIASTKVALATVTLAKIALAKIARATVTLTTVALAAVTLATVALAACGGDSDPPPAPQGTAQLGGAPSTPASTATTGPTATTKPTGGGGNPAPSYPKDAKTYAQELLRAWAGPTYTRLSQLATQSAVQQIRDSVTFGGKPNSTWTYITCRPGDTAFTACVFRNAHGDETTITLNDAQLGFPTAVTEAPLERTRYAASTNDYVSAFIYAWQQGNQQRMARYSSTSTKDYFMGQGDALVAYSLDQPVDIGGDHVTVQINDTSFVGGQDYVVTIASSSLGKANAIKGYCKGVGCKP